MARNRKRFYGLGLGARVHVVGVGKFGLSVVNNMFGDIDPQACIGVSRMMGVTGDQSVTSILPSVSRDESEILFDIIFNSDLVFIVADIDMEENNPLLDSICDKLEDNGISTYLVIPATNSFEIADPYSLADGEKSLVLEGLLLVSESSMSQPDLHSSEPKGARVDHLAGLMINQLYEPITKGSFVAVDFADLQSVMRRSLLRFGVGTSSGIEKACEAANKALACLANQELDPAKIKSAWCVLNGSSKLEMGDYNAVSKVISNSVGDDCITRLVVCLDESLGDTIMVTIVAGREIGSSQAGPTHDLLSESSECASS